MMSLSYCESHDDCIVVYESIYSCPVCQLVENNDDELDEAKETIKDLENEIAELK
jgi:hypothetical protein